MDQNTHFTALSSVILLLARAIESYGFDSRELFAKVGLDHSRLKDPLARFSYPAVTRLWALARDTTGDPCLGIKVASFWHPTTLHALGYSWLASNSLEEAFEGMSRYARLLNTGAQGVLKLRKTADAFHLILDPRTMKPQPHSVAIDSSMAMIMTMCRTAYGENLQPIRVSFQHPNPGCSSCFTDFFDAPVGFSQPETALLLDPQVVSTPLTTANPELVRVNDQIVTDYLAQLDRQDVSMQVRAKLIERLPSGQVSEEEIANSIHVSQRSLQRKLKEQGMSFTQLLENTRSELGLQYVRDPQRSFNEIAFLLGFSEPGNFSRAFKRWYGKSPSQYRDSVH
ncbi:MAG: AraC family transcriptional regulator [Gammaproteobacteria bacterium]